MQISKEADLKQLKDLGFNMYGDINIARTKLYESISNGNRRNYELIMFDVVTSKSYHELKTLLRKNDYMQRCTNTNAKAAVIVLLIFGEIQSMLMSPPSNAPIEHMEGIVNYFTERKVHPHLQRVLVFKDIVELLSILPEQCVSEYFYENLLDYVANIVFEFDI